MTQPQTQQASWLPLGVLISSPMAPFPSTSPTPLQVFTTISTLLAISILCLCLYRLYLHPLSSFPGPTHAALTTALELYDDVLRGGRFVWRVEAWHRRYGPVVRISPSELHVADPAFHARLYVSGRARRTDKCAWHARLFGSTATTVGAVRHDVHRVRREPLDVFFSSRNVGGEVMEEVVGRGVERLGEALRARAVERGVSGESKDETSRVVNLSAALAACSADIVGACVLGEGFGLLERDDLGEQWWRLMLNLSRNTHLMKHFGFIYTLFTYLPQRLVALLHPLTKQLFDVQNRIDARICEMRALLASSSPTTTTKIDETSSSSSSSSSSPSSTTSPRPKDTTLLTHLLTTTPHHDHHHHLADELFTLLGAGTLSTSHALSVLLYHVHAHPPHLARLRAELVPLYKPPSSRPSPSSLLAQPFLSACIHEALRLSHGVAGRLPRVAPDDELVLYTHDGSSSSSSQQTTWSIPRGATVSMTHMFLHLDERLFERAGAFVPERWMRGEGGENEKAKRHFFAPFGRGSRACVGRHLALAVMAAVVGEVVGALWVGRGDDDDDDGKRGGEGKEGEEIDDPGSSSGSAAGLQLRLYQTGQDEVDVRRDWFGGVPEAGMRCKGVRVMVEERERE